MIYTYPDYYDQFKCIAGDCQDTCCRGWQIVIDEDSLANYKSYQGEYKDKLHKSIKWKDEIFRQDKYGNCAFLNRDNLCEMYINMGENSLCKTCREYPRHTEEFENLREVSLSLSCPEVARLFLEHREKVTFTSREDEEEEMFEEFDYFLFTELCDIREEMMAILQNRELPIEERIEKILLIGQKAQELYEEGEIAQWHEEISKEVSYQSEDGETVTEAKRFASDEEQYQLLYQQFTYLYELELLNPEWEQVLVETESILFSKDNAYFQERKQAFTSWWKQSGLIPLDILWEQLLVYFITTYFLGAVYDERIDGKVDACVAHNIMLYLLLMARWIRNEEYLDQEDLIELIYRYSREIEHSDENLESVEEFDWFQRYED